VRAALLTVAFVSGGVVRDAAAFGIRAPVPFSSRARLEVFLVTDEATAPWPWDAQSRSPLDQSRFMIDLTAGEARTGTLYLKGAASWEDTDTDNGDVAFAIEQGDYAFGWRGLEVVAFGDERRFATGDVGAASMIDDDVERFHHRVGGRVDGKAGEFVGTAVVAELDEGNATRLLSYVKAGVATDPVTASLSYQLQDARNGSNHAVAYGELAGYWKRASVVASYQQSGFGPGVFLPDGAWGDLGDGGYGAASPDNSATFLELRLARANVGQAASFAGVYRYAWTGDEYTNDLAPERAGTELHRLGLYASSRRYALDGRVVLFDGTWPASPGQAGYQQRGVAATATAFLRDNSEVYLRTALADGTQDDGETRTSGVVHASYRRSLQRFMGGVDALVDEIGIDAVVRAGLEARVNWNATSALYLRWMVTGAVERADAVYARLEFRPTSRTYLTFAYGPSTTGDGPYFLEDRDAFPTVDTEDVFTVTIRGDF
jgi:hypothetical protein